MPTSLDLFSFIFKDSCILYIGKLIETTAAHLYKNEVGKDL